jgi:hypothetical protein
VSPPIFISYSSIDQSIAETICKALETRGCRCWISSRDIRPGHNFQESIVEAIRSAKVMLLVFTSNANNSDEIKKELVLAGQHHLTVIPVRVEDVMPSGAFAYEFATRQWVDLFKDWEGEIKRLALQIKSVLAAAPPLQEGGPALAETPRPQVGLSAGAKISRQGVLVALSIVAAMAAGIGGFYLYTRPTPTTAPRTTIVKEEPPIGQLPTGEIVLVDDGTCPPGQIKRVIGGNLAMHQSRLRSCIPHP